MITAKTALCALVASTVLAACSTDAMSEEDVKASLTAATFSALPNVNAESIEVLDPQRSPATWRWRAKADGKVYDCNADNQMRLPSCEALT